jgi:hypothetical protein
MKHVIFIAAWVLLYSVMPTAQSASRSLGTSAAADAQNTLWIAYAEQSTKGAFVQVSSFDEKTKAWRPPLPVNREPEPVSAEGENRPKIAFGPSDELYVTWTSPTSAHYTGDIRFARSLDRGKTWSAPITVHRDRQLITHRFESLLVDGEGRLWVTWVDKRDLHAAQNAKREYFGAAIYYAYSDDRGSSWQGDFKLADQMCECCRIALSTNPQGQVVALWRHIFPMKERDHATATLTTESTPPKISRATLDRWRVDACPHHGPGLTITDDGVRHAVWFSQKNGQARVFYGQLTSGAPAKVRELPQGATHADIAALDNVLAIAWKRFDGKVTRAETWISRDRGETFAPGPDLQTAGESDQPRLVRTAEDVFLIWRRVDGTAVQKLASGESTRSDIPTRSLEDFMPSAAHTQSVRPFGLATIEAIEEQHRGRVFWVVLWDLECTYCMKSLTNVAAAQAIQPDVRVVTITTDPIEQSTQIEERLEQLGVRSEAYAFSGASVEALRYAIDAQWAGEKPRAYRYLENGERTPISGVIPVEQLSEQGHR